MHFSIAHSGLCPQTNDLIENKREKEIELVIFDELHSISDSGGRGATLELLITLTLSMNIPSFAMSATISNIEELSQWMKADFFIASDDVRPGMSHGTSIILLEVFKLL